MDMLTKSLHTITAATNVARFVRDTLRDKSVTGDGLKLAGYTLDVLGYHYSPEALRAAKTADPTVARIVANCTKIAAGEPV